MPVNVEKVCWEKTDTFEDQIAAWRLCGCCYRVATVFAKSKGYPSAQSLDDAVIRHVRNLWNAPPPWVYESLKAINEQLAKLPWKRVEGKSPILEITKAEPLSAGPSGIFFLDYKYEKDQ